MLNRVQCKEIYGLDLDHILRCDISHSENSGNSGNFENVKNELTIHTIFDGSITISEASLGPESFYELYTYLFKEIPHKCGVFNNRS
jgi:hypothetical protein